MTGETTGGTGIGIETEARTGTGTGTVLAILTGIETGQKTRAKSVVETRSSPLPVLPVKNPIPVSLHSSRQCFY